MDAKSEDSDAAVDHPLDEQALLDAPSISSQIQSLPLSLSYDKSSLVMQTDPHYSIDVNKCGGICRGYIRQDWETLDLDHGLEELKAGWLELFFDLIFVACIVRISYEAMHSIPEVTAPIIEEVAETHSDHRRLLSSETHASGYCEDQGSYDFLLCCFAQFGLLTLFWSEQTMMETHFVLNQVMDYLMRLLFMSFVLCLGIFIYDDPDYQIAFQICYQGLKVVCIMIYFKVSMIPRAKIHAIYHIVECCIIIFALIFVVLFYRGCAINYFVIYCGFFVFEYLSTVLEWSLIEKETGKLKFALPLHIAHISERFGLFIMLILGESIISILSVATFSAGGWSLFVDIIFILMTFWMAFMIGALYYDSQPSEEEIMHNKTAHALKSTKCHRLLYIWGHQQLFFGLLAFGIGIKIAGYRLFDDIVSREWIDILLPSYGLVIIVIALFLIRASHPDMITSKLVWFIRFIILAIMCIVPIFALEINQSIIFGIMFCCILLLVVFDVEGDSKRRKKKQELKEKREKARKESIERHRDESND